MLTEKRSYHYIAKINLKRSHVLDKNCMPYEDKVNWLFLKIGEYHFSFIYKINEPLKSKYEEPFVAYISFTMIETVKEIVKLGVFYKILRGQENIGTIELVEQIG